MRKKYLKNNSGVTLLLSLLIMSGVVAVAIGLSITIVHQLEFSSNIDKAVTAFYAAESGIEKNLKIVKDNRNLIDLDQSFMDSNIRNNGGSLDNGARWNMGESAISEKYILTWLSKDTKATLDLPTGVDKIEVNWSDNCAGSSWVELGSVGIGGDASVQDSPHQELMPCEGTSSGLPCDEQILSHLNTMYTYVLTLRPLRCDVKHLTVEAFGPGPSRDPIDISNRAYLKSIGSYQGSNVSISASVPWRLPPQAIFDFVLFSGGTIIKE